MVDERNAEEYLRETKRVEPDERIVVTLASGETKTFDTKAKT